MRDSYRNDVLTEVLFLRLSGVDSLSYAYVMTPAGQETNPDSEEDRASELPQSFNTTRWSKVLQAADPHDSQASQALAELCTLYWRPLYQQARRMGSGHEEACDLVQSFVQRMIERNDLRHADPKRGRFRTFLLTSFQNFIRSDWRSNHALRRGGQNQPLSLDWLQEAGEQWEAKAHPTDDVPVEKAFDRSWAIALLGAGVQAVRRTYASRGQQGLFEQLAPYLLSTGEERNLADLSTKLRRPVGTVKSDLYRLRASLGAAIRAQIVQTVSNESDFDEELRYFRSLFGA